MIGKIISHYKIMEKLGEGGMGVVYKAQNTKLQRTVAIKVLKPEAIDNLEAKERFIREAMAASALRGWDKMRCPFQKNNHLFFSNKYFPDVQLICPTP